MNSKVWKSVIAAVPVIGISAWAAFTSPPFGGYPSQTSPMVWQCWSGLTERTSAVCQAQPLNPTNVIPSRTHWYLIQSKATVSNLLTTYWWAHTGWGISSTNRLTAANICALANVGADFWTNTPPAGMSTATNGWNGLMRVITNLRWTVEQGAPADCGGFTNVAASRSGAYCNVDTLESNYTFSATASGFPLYEARHWNPGTNVTYQGYVIQDEIIGPEGSDACGAMDRAAWQAAGYYWEILTNEWTACAVPAYSNWCFSVPPNTDTNSYRYTYTVTNTITDKCDALYACSIGTSCISSHLAPILFDNCTNRYGTNVTFTGEIYYNVGATGTCAGADATLTDPFGYGMAAGWTNLFGFPQTLFTNASICTTNFVTTNRVPWAGNTSTNPLAWVVYDALLVKKWAFDF